MPVWPDMDTITRCAKNFTSLIPLDMSANSSLGVASDPRFCTTVKEVFEVRRHIDLMRWLQGSVQHFLPHDILVAAWGDFHLGLIHYDVISAMPGVRSENAMAATITPLLSGLFDRWISQDRKPIAMRLGDTGFNWDGASNQGLIGDAMQTMRSSLIHGINDQRGRHDCLYVLFSTRSESDTEERNALRFLLPYIDTALRQVELLPNQYVSAKPPASDVASENTVVDASESGVLSEREAEIMKWVAMGKTNAEIGSILNVSSFTIKNHMQRIFKKLDVFNRAQAVSMFGVMP
jgi:transcriptional regulator EpsA